jgi:hypothetical protein
MSLAVATVLVAASIVAIPYAPAPMITLEQFIRVEAQGRGLDPDRAWRAVELESAGNPAAVGQHGEAGLWQVKGEDTTGTWGWFCELTGHPEWKEDENRFDWYRATIVSLDAIALGYGDHWAGWRLAGEL